MPDGNSWGVYVRPEGISPSTTTITGSAQVTIVVHNNFVWDNLTSYSGLWSNNATVSSPVENPDMTYYSFGLVTDVPQIIYYPDSTTLLFTFRRASSCPDTIYLIDNQEDPFAQAPNSVNSNPGNEISVFDLTNAGFYNYAGNYAPSAWSCHDCDSDGIPNALEDTNGDGAWTPGVDASDLCGDSGGGGCEDPVFSQQPQDVLACHDGEAVFTTNAGSVSYQWQTSSDEGLNWLNLPESSLYSGTTTEALTVANVSGLNGYLFRVIARDDECETISELAKLSLDGPFTITQQPADFSGCNAGEAVFTVGFENLSGNITGAVFIQWQESNDNGLTWNELTDGAAISGTQTTALKITDLAGKDQNQYRVSVRSDVCGPVFSGAATLHLEGQPEFLAQPQSSVFCPVEPACFSFEMNNLNDPNLAIQWQIQIAGNTPWENLSDNFIFNGAHSNQLCIEQPVFMQGSCVRVVVTSACGELVSEPACINIRNDLSIVEHPQNVTICDGEDASFTAKVAWDCDVTGVTYQWEVTSDGLDYEPDVTSSLTVNGPDPVSSDYEIKLAIPAGEASNGRGYRLRTTLLSGENLFTETAWLKVEGPVQFDEQPASETVCSGSEVVLKETASSATGEGTIFYQWQTAANGSGWTDLSENATFSGVNSNSLKINDVSGWNGRQFRCMARTGACSWVNSSDVLLTVEGPLSVAVQPQDGTACPDDGLVFVADVKNAGTGTLQLNWQVSNNGGNSWTNLAEGQATGFGGTYSGTKSNSLTISRSEGLHGQLYRLAASTSVCNVLTSAAVLKEDENLCPPPAELECLGMTIRWIPFAQRWGIFVRPQGFTPPAYTRATSGRVTIVTPVGFTWQNLISSTGGTWTPGTVLFNPKEAPGMQYMTFNLTPGPNQLLLADGEEVLLFSIQRVGQCPSEIYLMQDVPAGILPNDFTGYGLGLGFGPDVSFHLCGTYDPHAGNCNGSSALILPIQQGFSEVNSAEWFSISPNPASDWVKIDFKNDEVENGASLQLTNLHGQVLRNEKVTASGQVQLEIGDLPKGFYFLTLKADGKVLQREKLVKN